MNLKKSTKYFISSTCFIAFLGCKNRFISDTRIKSLPATHVLQSEFSEATGKIEYSFTGAEAEKEEIKSVKVSQLKSSDKAVFYKGKINSNFLMGYDQEKKFYPSYTMEVVTTNLNCRTIEAAWMGSKEIGLNCVRSSSQPPQPQADGGDQGASPASPKPSETPTSVRPTASPAATTQPSNTQVKKTPIVPSSALECSGTKIRPYAVCRFFEGGHYGCYEKHRCITRMSASKCASVKTDLKNTYPWMASRWDCTAGVTP